MDFRNVCISKPSPFDDLWPWDFFKNKNNTRNYEEHPENGSMQDEEDPERYVQHVCPVKYL